MNNSGTVIDSWRNSLIWFVEGHQLRERTTPAPKGRCLRPTTSETRGHMKTFVGGLGSRDWKTQAESPPHSGRTRMRPPGPAPCHSSSHLRSGRGQCAGEGRRLGAGLERESQVLRLLCWRPNFQSSREQFLRLPVLGWRQLLGPGAARSLSFMSHASRGRPCTWAPVHSQPESGVPGSLRTRGWAGAESPPPRSLLPVLAAWPHPAWPSHSAPEARGLRGLRVAPCSACAHAFCSNCFLNLAAKPGACCRGPGKRGAWALCLESVSAPSRPRGVRSRSLKPQPARPEPKLTSRVKATRGI